MSGRIEKLVKAAEGASKAKELLMKSLNELMVYGKGDEIYEKLRYYTSDMTYLINAIHYAIDEEYKLKETEEE